MAGYGQRNGDRYVVSANDQNIKGGTTPSTNAPLMIAPYSALNEVTSWNGNYHHFAAIFIRGAYNLQAINALFQEHLEYRQGNKTKATCLFPL